jgi:transcriptional regulator with PAS, ATPase and Fis domain
MGGGRFREDLFYRLNVFHIPLPPLRERRGDVPALAATFLQEFGQELGKGALRLSERAAGALQLYPWRGNVRELRNLMERAAVLINDGEVDEGLIETLLPVTGHEVDPLDLAAAVAQTERRTILRALAAADDNKAKAADRAVDNRPYVVPILPDARH